MKNKFLETIEAAKTIAITGHTRPDGDCVGTALGLYNYIISNYHKQVTVYLEPFPNEFKFLKGADLVKGEADDTIYDLFIVVDCGGTDRFPMFAKVYENAKYTMCVDHHISNKGFGDWCKVDVDACSAAEAIYKLVDADKINKNAAECLYMGIVHDTGVFKHSNTTKSAMSIAGDLIEKGANPAFIIDETFYKKTLIQNKLLGIALNKMIQFADGKITATVLDLADYRSIDAHRLDAEGIVDQLRVTEGTEVAMFISEVGEGEYKISLRSNNIVDVSKIALNHDGGGHIRAAGFTMKGTKDGVVETLVAEIVEQL